MLKIERQSYGRNAMIRLSGRIRSTDMDNIRAQMGDHLGVIFDLSEVTLVDIEVVRFLSDCERSGVELLGSPAFVRAWIERERSEGERHNTV